MEVDSWENYGEFSSQPCLIGAGNDAELFGFFWINMDKVVHLGRESSAKMGTMPSSRCLSLCVHGIHSNTLLFFRNNRLSHRSFDHFAPNFCRPHLGHPVVRYETKFHNVGKPMPINHHKPIINITKLGDGWNPTTW